MKDTIRLYTQTVGYQWRQPNGSLRRHYTVVLSRTRANLPRAVARFFQVNHHVDPDTNFTAATAETTYHHQHQEAA